MYATFCTYLEVSGFNDPPPHRTLPLFSNCTKYQSCWNPRLKVSISAAPVLFKFHVCNTDKDFSESKNGIDTSKCRKSVSWTWMLLENGSTECTVFLGLTMVLAGIKMLRHLSLKSHDAHRSSSTCLHSIITTTWYILQECSQLLCTDTIDTIQCIYNINQSTILYYTAVQNCTRVQLRIIAELGLSRAEAEY